MSKRTVRWRTKRVGASVTITREALIAGSRWITHETISRLIDRIPLEVTGPRGGRYRTDLTTLKLDVREDLPTFTTEFAARAIARYVRP